MQATTHIGGYNSIGTYIYTYIYRKLAFFHSQNIFVFSKKTKIFYMKYSKTFIYTYIRIKLFRFQQNNENIFH